MTRRKSVLGLAILGALCVCAFSANSALAAPTGFTLHECKAKGSGGTGVLYNANCAAKETNGSFETVPLSGKVKVKATGTTSFSLAAIVGGVKFKITCEGLEAEPEVQNVLTGETHHVTDEGPTTFTNCGVTEPAGRGCVVPSPLTTENLTSDTDDSGNTKFLPAAGPEEPFIVIPVTGCSSSALNGNKAVRGFAQSARATATTQTFTSTSGSELTFGGQKATFTGDYHLSTSDGTILALEQAGE